jgi:hypothetical protein
MKTIRIAKVVKYKGVVYPANTDIVVDDKDVSDLLSRGGWIINKGSVAKPTVEDTEDPAANEESDDVAEAEEADREAKAKELRALRSKAKKLGIEVNPDWSANKLKRMIATAQAE